MENLRKIFVPLIGQLVWHVHRGVGSFLNLEFGMPHLSIREPVPPRSRGRSPKVQRNLARRGVYVSGDWHLSVQYGDWLLSTSAGALSSENCPGSASDEFLRDLDGQRFLCVDRGDKQHSCVFRFDLGGVLEIWPSTEIPEDQWSLHVWKGEIVSYTSDGDLVFSKPDPDDETFKRLG